MPKVHEDQKAKFQEDLFAKFHKDTEIKYALPKSDMDDKVAHLKKELREGVGFIAFKACGTNLPLRFPNNGSDPPELPGKEWVDFEKEEGKVHIQSQMILNGVCCQLVVNLDLNTFDGFGHLEMDEDLAKREANSAKDVVDIMPRRGPAFPVAGQAVPKAPGVQPLVLNQAMWPAHRADSHEAISDVKREEHSSNFS